MSPYFMRILFSLYFRFAISKVTIFPFFPIFIALYLGLVVGEKHVYSKYGLSTRPLHFLHLKVFSTLYIVYIASKESNKIVNTIKKVLKDMVFFLFF